MKNTSSTKAMTKVLVKSSKTMQQHYSGTAVITQVQIYYWYKERE